MDYHPPGESLRAPAAPAARLNSDEIAVLEKAIARVQARSAEVKKREAAAADPWSVESEREEVRLQDERTGLSGRPRRPWR